MTEPLTKEQKYEQIKYKKQRAKKIIALSPYSTHNKSEVPLDLWFQIKHEARSKGTSINSELNKLYGRA